MEPDACQIINMKYPVSKLSPSINKLGSACNCDPTIFHWVYDHGKWQTDLICETPMSSFKTRLLISELYDYIIDSENTAFNL